MKITKIETLRLPEHPCTVWVQLYTSDGLIGLGETYYVPGAAWAGSMFRQGQDEVVFLIYAAVYGLAALCWFAVDVTKRLTDA